MGVPIGAIGAMGTGAGSLANAYGQGEALKSMRGVWDQQGKVAALHDAQLNQRTAELVNSLGTQRAMGEDRRAAVGQQMDASARNASAAAATQVKRRRGGARGGAEAKAVGAQANQGNLAAVLRDGNLASIIAGMQSGSRDMDMLGRSYALDARNIRGDAQRYANLAPLQERAAGFDGGWARQIGNLFSTLGQGAMSYGMSQPGGTADAAPALPGQSPEDYGAMGHSPAHYGYKGP